jgi:type II secretory pathway pseudopilin PulG
MNGSSSGFITLTLLLVITAVSILSTRIMVNAAHEVQREHEAELIFRGEAIAKAIRLYKKKTGSYPLTLNDLTTIRPRIIRKVYKDPMTICDHRYSGDWDLVLYEQHYSVAEKIKDDIKSPTPIVGVRSFCKKNRKKIYQGKDLISDWLFLALDPSEMSEAFSMH